MAALVRARDHPDSGEWRHWRAKFWADPSCWRREIDHLFREPEREPHRDYLPSAAKLDGLEGRALNCWHGGGPEAETRQVAYAEADLEDLGRFRRRFRRQDPDAARAISAPLREYARRLRQVRDHPETRAYALLEARLYPRNTRSE